MMKRWLALLLCAALAAGLCGCGSIFDKEYVVEQPYVLSTGDPNAAAGVRISVSSFAQLKQALLNLVSEGKTEGSLVFDSAYDGDVTEDMASACWEVRSQDALCAYCVQNIAYELSKIVTYYEAKVTVSYSGAVMAPTEIQRLSYSTGIGEIVQSGMENGQKQMAILVDHSTYTAEQVENLVFQTYSQHPAIAPREPLTEVKILSGSGTQRLYEINLDFGVSAKELESARREMEELDPFAQLDSESMSEAQRALLAARYLTENCEWSPAEPEDSVYSALITGRAGDEGMAYAYVELCRRMGLNCSVIRGQKDWEDYCWNIVQIDGAWYHVDLGSCIQLSYEQGFLLRDEAIWSTHRWDTGTYPQCSGELNYLDLLEAEQGVPATLALENPDAEELENSP